MSNSEAGGNENPPSEEGMHPWEMALFSPPRPRPRPRAPPIMGAPGRTAFGPYRPPPPPPPPSLGHGPRALGIQAFPLGGGGGVAVGGGVRIGGSLSSSGRKRGREGNRAGEGGGGQQHHCSVCNKGFGSSKALFGHMRSHPDRGWKGVHPPPAFRAEEEFADLHVAEDPDADAHAQDQDGLNFKLPDLNHPPPPDPK